MAVLELSATPEKPGEVITRSNGRIAIAKQKAYVLELISTVPMYLQNLENE